VGALVYGLGVDEPTCTPLATLDSGQHETLTTDPDTNQQSEASTTYQISKKSTRFTENEQSVQVKYAYREIIDEELLAAQMQEIDEYFNELSNFLRKGEKVPSNIPLIKKICHLIDTGGQRAFLELLPTVTVGKALSTLYNTSSTVKMGGIGVDEQHQAMLHLLWRDTDKGMRNSIILYIVKLSTNIIYVIIISQASFLDH
jgi:hypothetical protein